MLQVSETGSRHRTDWQLRRIFRPGAEESRGPRLTKPARKKTDRRGLSSFVTSRPVQKCILSFFFFSLFSLFFTPALSSAALAPNRTRTPPSTHVRRPSPAGTQTTAAQHHLFGTRVSPQQSNSEQRNTLLQCCRFCHLRVH